MSSPNGEECLSAVIYGLVPRKPHPSDGIRIAESGAVPRLLSRFLIGLAVLVAGATIGLSFLSFVREVESFERPGFAFVRVKGALLVDSVEPDSSASVAGLAPGDRIITVDGQVAGSVPEPQRTLARAPFPHILAVEKGGAEIVPIQLSKPPLSIEELFFKHLRPGDIFTHCFAQLATREFIVDTTTKEVKPFVLEAQKKGIVFDVGYGGISFSFSQAIPAVKNGFYPNSISTDLHTGSMNNAMKDQLNVMSKFIVMGMSLGDVIKAATWNPAKEIKREELGNLSVGSVADVTVLNLREGKFGYFDYVGYKIEGNKKLECEVTIRGGKIVYDLNGLANPVFVTEKK